MVIRVFAAAASAATPLAAFDRALHVGQVHDTNLIKLSSIVPPGAEVKRETVGEGTYRFGDRLYCVLAEQRIVERGGEAWAGLAWACDANGGGGVFVEAFGHSEHQVQYDLERSLASLIEDRSYLSFDDRQYEVVGIACEEQPVCALVMAVFEAEPWPA